MTNGRAGAVRRPQDRGAFGEPAPSLRRPRNVPGAVLGVLVVIVSALVVASLASSAGNRTTVLVVVRPVAAGTRITSSDLAGSGVSAGGLVHGISAANAGEVVGRIAAHDLVPGTLVVTADLATGPSVAEGQDVVGLAVKDGDLPADLTPPDRVEVIATAPGSGATAASVPTVLVANAQVRSVTPSADGQSTLVSISAPASEAPAVSGANAQGAVSLASIGGGP